MTQFAPGLLKIKGKRCLIIADSVSHTLPESGVVLLKQTEGLNIFCLAAELAAKKAAHPDIPVYGYWQTLYATQHWRPSSGVVAYRHQHSGQYVAVDSDEKTATTGEVIDGHALAAAGEQLEQQRIKWLEVSVDEITLPSRPAMTMAEQIAAQQQSNKALLLAGFFALLALLAGAFLGAWFGDRETQQSLAQRAALAAEVEAAAATVDKLAKTKLVAIPNQQPLLELLAALSWVEDIDVPNAKIDALQISVPYRSYMDAIYLLAQHDIAYTEHWLAEGRVAFHLQW